MFVLFSFSSFLFSTTLPLFLSPCLSISLSLYLSASLDCREKSEAEIEGAREGASGAEPAGKHCSSISATTNISTEHAHAHTALLSGAPRSSAAPVTATAATAAVTSVTTLSSHFCHVLFGCKYNLTAGAEQLINHRLTLWLECVCVCVRWCGG